LLRAHCYSRPFSRFSPLIRRNREGFLPCFLVGSKRFSSPVARSDIVFFFRARFLRLLPWTLPSSGAMPPSASASHSSTFIHFGLSYSRAAMIDASLSLSLLFCRFPHWFCQRASCHFPAVPETGYRPPKGAGTFPPSLQTPNGFAFSPRPGRAWRTRLAFFFLAVRGCRCLFHDPRFPPFF